MKAFLDTSVLVPVFYGDHIHHEASLALFIRFDKSTGCCGVHSLAEVFSTLTRMPGKHRISGEQAMLFIGGIRERLSIIALPRFPGNRLSDAASGSKYVADLIPGLDAQLAFSGVSQFGVSLLAGPLLRSFNGKSTDIIIKDGQPGPQAGSDWVLHPLCRSRHSTIPVHKSLGPLPPGAI
jgi:hypothetical protein